MPELPRTRPSPVSAEQGPAPRQWGWAAQWAAVSPLWQAGVYAIDQAPFDAVFVQNARYQRGRQFDFRPAGHPRLGQELAWWVWTCQHEGLRKIEPSMLRWWATAVGEMATARARLTGQPVTSIAQFAPHLVAREAVRLFTQRNHRPPSPGNLRNLVSIADHLHLMVSVRASRHPWWTHEVWNLQVDNRIPRRAHEPAGDQPVVIGAISPTWLREATRSWLSTTLTYQVYRWTTVVTRARNIAAYLGRYLTEHDITDPVISTDPATLRSFFTGFASWLHSPAATHTGQPLAATGTAAVLSHTQSLYLYLLHHTDDLIAFTGDRRWGHLSEAHARLFTHTVSRARRTNRTGPEPIAAADLARMIACLDILAAPTTESVTVELPAGRRIRAHGLGDPQAARAWLLQALTGRRVSEILMLDFDPLTAIPGIDPATSDDSAFVARLRYQQTKIDGIDPSILVDQAVVAIIHEQQQWARARVDPGVTPPYLFLNPRHNHRGHRPRSYTSHQSALTRLNAVTALTDSTGNPLSYTKTHRLRHTRATELLNAGVPIHVVQRYLGHKSPEMTMHYAATLADVAEAEFLKAHRIGAFGADLTLNPRDLLAITQLEQRADRALPNGLCTLPPAKSCDRGNACLTCGHFATDASHLDEHRDQHRRTLALIDIRQGAFTARHGQPMPDTNVWLAERRKELASLQAIITRLTDAAPSASVRGAGTTARHPGTAESPP